MKRVHVAAAVIVASDGRILLARRPDHLHQGGLWEFPGGKLDAGETAQQALQRELQEELAITIDLDQCRPLLKVSHDYADKQVLLDFWRVTCFSGIPQGNEGQLIEWVLAENFWQYTFPEANQPVVELLQR